MNHAIANIVVFRRVLFTSTRNGYPAFCHKSMVRELTDRGRSASLANDYRTVAERVQATFRTAHPQSEPGRITTRLAA